MPLKHESKKPGIQERKTVVLVLLVNLVDVETVAEEVFPTTGGLEVDLVAVVDLVVVVVAAMCVAKVPQCKDRHRHNDRHHRIPLLIPHPLLDQHFN